MPRLRVGSEVVNAAGRWVAMTYIVQRKSRFYVVAYDGIDTLTGRERRRWHPAGHSRTDAEAIAANLDLELAAVDTPTGADPLTVARYLTEQWLPVRRHDLDPSHRPPLRLDHRPLHHPRHRTPPAPVTANRTPRPALHRPPRHRRRTPTGPRPQDRVRRPRHLPLPPSTTPSTPASSPPTPPTAPEPPSHDAANA